MTTAALPSKFWGAVALLDCENEGERVAALNAANRMLAERGLKWREIRDSLSVTSGGASPFNYRPATERAGNERELAAMIWSHPEFRHLAARHRYAFKVAANAIADGTASPEQLAFIRAVAANLWGATDKP